MTVELTTPSRTRSCHQPHEPVHGLAAHWDAKLAASGLGDDPAERAQAGLGGLRGRPLGSGPSGDALVPRERLDSPRTRYWDESAARRSTGRAVPLPEANARTAALLAGQVD
jgi:hypothetical protein